MYIYCIQNKYSKSPYNFYLLSIIQLYIGELRTRVAFQMDVKYESGDRSTIYGRDEGRTVPPP